MSEVADWLLFSNSDKLVLAIFSDKSYDINSIMELFSDDNNTNKCVFSKSDEINTFYAKFMMATGGTYLLDTLNKGSVLLKDSSSRGFRNFDIIINGYYPVSGIKFYIESGKAFLPIMAFTANLLINDIEFRHFLYRNIGLGGGRAIIDELKV